MAVQTAMYSTPKIARFFSAMLQLRSENSRT